MFVTALHIPQFALPSCGGIFWVTWVILWVWCYFSWVDSFEILGLCFYDFGGQVVFHSYSFWGFFLLIVVMLHHTFSLLSLLYLNMTLSCDKWVPVNTAWHVLRLHMEEQPPIWRVAANIFNKQSRTADKGWSSSLGFGRGANNCSPLKRILLWNDHAESLRPGLILWCDLSNGKGTWDLVLGMLEACIGQVHLQVHQGISKI